MFEINRIHQRDLLTATNLENRRHIRQIVENLTSTTASNKYMANAKLQLKQLIKQSILIWVDNNVESNDSDTKKTIDKLNELVCKIVLIKTPATCIEMLKEVEPTKCYLITSGVLGKELMPRIHSLSHLEAIFIFCANKTHHEIWTNEFSKIRGVHTDIDPIYNELRSIIKQVQNDNVPTSIITRDKENQSDLEKLPPSFMYSSMLKEIFLTMKFEQKHFDKMIEKLLFEHHKEKNEMFLVKNFAKQYQSQEAIRWYTGQSFIYNDVNHALRLLEGGMIVDMAPFIIDLHKQIGLLYEQQKGTRERTPFNVYRGQGMTKVDFHNLTQSKNGLLSFNSFLSTSIKREIAIDFAEHGARRPEHIGLLFVININPMIHVVPYAHIREHSQYKEEDEVLFSMHSIFKIGNFKSINDCDYLFEVELQLTDDDDPKLLALKRHISAQYGVTPEHRLGRTLNDMGEYEKAGEIYSELLKTTTNKRQRGIWNHQLGIIKDRQGKYEEAIEYYRNTLNIYETELAENDPKIPAIYSQIGLSYKSMKNFSEARTYCERSLEIYKKIRPDDHTDLATSYNNVASVYDNMGYYQDALNNYEKSLEIYEKKLPDNHPHIATTCNNIGVLYYNMKKYEKALIYLKIAHRILTDSLPAAHPNIKIVNNWIEAVEKDIK